MTLAQALIAARREQRLPEHQPARDRGARGTPVWRGGKLGGDRVCRFRHVDQPPRQQDFLVADIGPFEIGDGDAAVGAEFQRLHEFARHQRLDVTFALQRLLVRVQGIGHVDGEHKLEEPRFDVVVFPQRVRQPGIDHPALGDHVHEIDQLERQRGVLLDQQNGQPLLLELGDRLPQALDDDRRQPFRRLVHDQAIGIGHQPAADGEHLLLAAGQRLGALAPALAQPRKQRIDPLQAPAVALGAVPGDQEIVLDAERRKHPAALRHQPDAAAHDGERRIAGDVGTLEIDLAAARRREADDGIDDGGLADAVPAEQAENLALLELKRQALQHIGVAVIGMDVLDVEDRHAVPR